MEKGFEGTVPTINMNIYIQNYTNINNINGKSFDIPTFHAEKTKEMAKQQPYVRRIETTSDFLSLPKSSSETVSPKAVSQTSIKEEEEVQVKPIVAKKQSELYEKREEVDVDNNLAPFIGVGLLLFAACLFIGVFYAMIVSPLVGETGHVLLDFVKADNYYCFLVPLLIPASLIFIYANWVSVKFFRHT